MSGAVTRGRAGGRSGRRRYEEKNRAPGAVLLALIRHVLRLQSRGVAVWGLALGLYGAVIVATYTTFARDAEQMDQLVKAYPRGLREAFGLADSGTIEGFLDVQVFTLAPLAVAFFTILAAANAIAGAEERGTMDVLLGNPLRRWQLVVGNFFATALSLLGILAIAAFMTWGTASLVDTGLALGDAVGGFLNLWPISVLFGGLAMLCSAFFRRRALAVAVPAFLLFAMYLLDTMGNVSEDVEDYQPASAFHYYGSAITDGIDWGAFFGVAGIALAFVLLAAVAFGRRDIYT